MEMISSKLSRRIPPVGSKIKSSSAQDCATALYCSFVSNPFIGKNFTAFLPMSLINVIADLIGKLMPVPVDETRPVAILTVPSVHEVLTNITMLILIGLLYQKAHWDQSILRGEELHVLVNAVMCRLNLIFD